MIRSTPPTVLNWLACAVLVLCGPALTVVFWQALEGARFPYREQDIANGLAGVLASTILLVVAIAVGVRRSAGSQAAFVNWIAVAALTLSGLYCGVVGTLFLVNRGQACSDEYCMYEIAQIVWWLLWAFAWLVATVLGLLAAGGAIARRGR